MPKTHPPYSPEFRRQMVDLVRAIQFLGPPLLLAWFYWIIGGDPLPVLSRYLPENHGFPARSDGRGW